jgi:hypothetical protein
MKVLTSISNLNVTQEKTLQPKVLMFNVDGELSGKVLDDFLH